MRIMLRDLGFVVVAAMLAFIETHLWDREWNELSIYLLCSLNQLAVAMLYFSIRAWRRS